MYLFPVLDKMFLTAVRHEVNNLESSDVVQELESENILLKRVLWNLGNSSIVIVDWRASTIGISEERVHSILTKDLVMRKFSVLWVPRF